MTKIRSYLCICFLLLSLWGCKDTVKESEKMPYHPYVEAFTYGSVSRYTPVYLIFNHEIPAEKLQSESLRRLMKLTPEVPGEFSFENSKTIMFKPTEGFDRNTTYRIKANLSEWFDLQGKDKNFTFSFSTLPLSIRGNLHSIDINNKNENGYDLACTFYTPDKEDPKTVESLLKYSEKAETVWAHDPNGKKHQLTLMNVPAGSEGARVFEVSVGSNKWGVDEEKLFSVDIPGMNDFSVYNVEYVSAPERFVEVSFTKLLDDSQNMQGLAYIDGNKSDAVNVEGNKLRLYPDANQTGAINVHLSKVIRSKQGISLKDNVVRQLSVNEMFPGFRFIGQGVIIPLSNQLSIPFQAVYLRGVIVRVIRIMEQNIGQFLQENDLDGSSELVRVGRLVARKTILFDEDASLDLSQWNTFGIDLKELITPEPGAIYRVELSFNKSLSAYPCSDNVPLSKEQIAAEDELRFKEECNRFDGGGYFYYSSGLSWEDYNYEENRNPCSNSYYYNVNQGRNVLATNLGLMAKAGEENEMIVLVHNLLTANPEKGVEVKAYNYQRQELAAALTDADGKVRLSLDNGKPFYLIASLGNQRSYLRVDNGSSLSLSSFDVSGEVVQKGIKGFVYGDRGVWRPGDTLHLGFMLNDRMKKLPADHPVILELYNPLGQLYLRRTETRGELGVYAFDVSTESDAPTGIWNAKVNVGGVVFEKRLRIETIKPNRLKIDLKLQEKQTLLRGRPLELPLHVEWLQGATARNLKYDIQGTFIATQTTFDAYKNFTFDDLSKEFSSEESALISGTTDESGDAMVRAQFDVGNSAPGMLLANLTVRAFEESGDFSIDACRTLYSPYNRYVGIRSPQQGKEQLDTRTPYTYELVSVNHIGQPQAGTKLEAKIFKVNWYWWWSSDASNLANYVSNSYNEPVKTVSVYTDDNGVARFKLQFTDEEWGTYFISVKDLESKHSTGLMSYFDWPGTQGRRNADGSSASTMLTFKTDKDDYKPGEKMTVSFPSVKGARAIVSIENGSRVLFLTEQACAEGETTVKLEMTPEMQPNAYVHITLLQPHGITKNDLPIRMYGVVPFTVTAPESRLTPEIRMADEIKPDADYEVTISEKNRQEMAYTLAIVDEGLLDLTRFPTPDPWKTFNAREALGVNTWDLYNYVVGAYGGRIEQLFSIGGDDALNRGPKAVVNRFKPVVQFVGPMFLKKGEQRKHSFKMPNYTGRVRVMVVAGNGYAYGNSEKSVFVRKPVMLLGTLPRIIGVGEEMVVPATVFATEKGVGNVQVNIACSDNMEIMDGTSRTLHFSEKEDQSVAFRIKVKDLPGAGKVTLTATGKGEKSVYETDIEVRTIRRAHSKVTAVTLEPGKSWKKMVTLPGIAGTNSMLLEMSNIQPVNLSARLKYLFGYPHGCLEQITSKAFPQLYLKTFASLTQKQEKEMESTVKEVIRRMQAYQTVDGSFAYWPGATSSDAWATIYAVHFLLEAEAKGYVVQKAMKQNALNSLRRIARAWKPVQSYYARSEEMAQAYRLFVLAQAHASEVGAMNRLKENKNLAPMSRWLLAAAYASIGRSDVGEKLTERVSDLQSNYQEYDQTFGSDLRDRSIRLMTLCLFDNGKEAAIDANEISKQLSSDTWFSTQSVAFGLVALSNYMERYKVSETLDFSYNYGGKTEKVSIPEHVWSESLLEQGTTSSELELKNTGKSTLFARIITEGIAEQGQEKAYSNGISLAVSYMDKNGREVDVADMEQGTNFTAVVSVRNASPRGYTRLVLSQIFPAGWEILNTRFLNEGEADKTTAGVNYQDIRDDRVYSYIDYLPAGKQVTVKINLCAVYPGRFYLPPVYCEAMYDQLINANTESRETIVR